MKIMLAFSGGLDTSAIIPWLKETYNANVIAYCCDLGNAPNKEALTKWAKTLGASELIFEDVQDQFVSDFITPMLKSGAKYQDDYLLGTSIARPLIAEKVAYWAKVHQCDAIAHGATGKGNDQLRFEKSWAYLCPNMKIIAPWKEWTFTGRKELINYLASCGIDFPEKVKTYSVDTNLFHNSTEGKELENPELEYNPKEVCQWIQTGPINDSYTVAIKFHQGTPIAINDENLGPSDLLKKLNEIGSKAGIGLIDLVESRTIGLKSRGIYETPGGTLWAEAIKHLKHMNWDRTTLKMSKLLSQELAELIYDGLWHHDATKAALKFFEETGKNLSGTIKFKLQNGHMIVAKRQSTYSLYQEKLSSFESDDYAIHKNAAGYCKIVCFNQMVSALRDQQNL